MSACEDNFFVNVACASLDHYLAVLRLLGEDGVAEQYRVEVHCEDARVSKVLNHKLGWDGRDETMPPLEAMLRTLAEDFPPAFRHADLFHNPPFKDSDDPNFKRLLRRDARERKIDRIQVFVTLRSPEQMPISSENVLKFLDEFYLPQMLGVVFHEDFLPDDLSSTRNLLAGLPDAIRPDDRTFRLTFPCRDVTNSVAVADMVLDGTLDAERVDFAGHDLHVLPIEIIEPAYLHLIMLSLMHSCRPSRGYRPLIAAKPIC